MKEVGIIRLLFYFMASVTAVIPQEQARHPEDVMLLPGPEDGQPVQLDVETGESVALDHLGEPLLVLFPRRRTMKVTRHYYRRRVRSDGRHRDGNTPKNTELG